MSTAHSQIKHSSTFLGFVYKYHQHLHPVEVSKTTLKQRNVQSLKKNKTMLLVIVSIEPVFFKAHLYFQFI